MRWRSCAPVVREADPRVQEEIKWIFPSFFVTDHFATTSLPPRGPLRLVLHTGAKKQAVAAAVSIDDEGGLLEWKGSDRAVLTFRGIEQVRERRRAVQDLIRQ